MRIGLAQLNTRVGAVEANIEMILRAAEKARDEHHCDLLLLPELALSGYPPEDLLLRRGLRNRVERALEQLLERVRGIALCVGFPEFADGVVYNSAALLVDGDVIAKHRKMILPNYAVFDEKRYFEPGTRPAVVDWLGMRLGILVCEDVWFPGPASASVAAGAELLLVINGSPYHTQQQAKREAMVGERARENAVPVVYLNMVGGQDELVFDGGSFVVDKHGDVIFRAPEFEEDLYVVEAARAGDECIVERGTVTPTLSVAQAVYGALCLGTRDYVEKNGFPGVVLGLSGGIDSALTLAVAVDALGAKRVRCVMMPSRFTSSMSLEDARAQADTLGVRYDVLPIEPMFKATLATLDPVFAGLPADATEENIQARCRGILLMAMSNKLGDMLLTTGNKSEMAVGYATLYGDMAGGFAPLKDCSKTLVYELARVRNERGPVIPERVITREPSAELAADQKDSDSLPPYDVLDAILEAFVEKAMSADEIVGLGFDADAVTRVLGMVKRAEYKRRQAPPGVRVSSRAFGRDWRYPITSGY